MPSACSRPSSVYSWFIASRPRARAVERIEVHAVVVHAHLHGLVGGAVGAVSAPRRHVARHADRFAPGGDDLGDVALGHDQRVGAGRRHGLEAEQRLAEPRSAGAAARQRPEQRARRRAERQPQHRAPRRVGDAVDVVVGRAVAVLHRVEVLGHRLSPQSFSVSPARGCHFIRCRSMRPTAASSSSANAVSTRMPAITVLMSKLPSACRIR